MIGAMMMMLQLCTKIRRESDMSARKRSFLGKYELVSCNYKEIQVGSSCICVGDKLQDFCLVPCQSLFYHRRPKLRM